MTKITDLVEENIFGNKDILKKKAPVSLTIGNFDGVHLGHQFLLRSLREMAGEREGVVVITFDPHPFNFFNPQNPKKLLTSLQERIQLLLKYGADVVYVQSFVQEFANLSADDFCDIYLAKNFNIKNILIGHDFCYGKGKQGNEEHLRHFALKWHWNIKKCPTFFGENKNTPISSSLIRQALERGDREEVNALLGRSSS